MSADVFAQNTIVVKNISFGPYCPSQEIEIGFTTSGNFAADNQFKVQVSDKNGSNFVDIGISGKSSPIKIQLPANLTEASGYQIRVVSSSPVVTGIPSNAIRIINKPKAVLSTAFPNELKYPTNANQSFNLNIVVSNGLPCDVVLSDSSKFRIDYNNYNFYVRPFQSTTYKIDKISNQCGLGEGTGTIVASINQVGLKILNPGINNSFCPGGNISFSYTINGKTNTDNKFKLLISATTGTYEKTIDLTTVANAENTLTGILPTDLENGKAYMIRLQGSSPTLMSAPSSIYVPQKATGEVGLYNQYETPVIYSTAYGGVPPYKITYSDGTTYSGTSNLSIPLQHYDYKKLKTTLEDQCGAIKYLKDSVEVSGFQYMMLDSLPTKPFCTAETIEIPFKSNIPFTSKTKFMVRFNPTNSFNIYTGSYVVEAQRQGDKLLVKTPQTIGFYYVVVETQNPTFNGAYAQGEIEISSKGTASIGYENYYSYERLSFKGVFNPYSAKIKIDDNEINLNKADFVYNEDSRSYYFPLSSSKSSKYTLVSVENGCGLANIQGNTIVTRTAPKTFSREIIIGDLPKAVYCNGEEISIPFKVNGTLNSDETIELHVLSQDYSDFSYKIGSSKTSPLKAVLNNSSSGIIRIALKISNTEIQSEVRHYKLKYKPTVYLSASLPDGQPVLKGQRVPISLSSNGTFPAYYNLNGKVYTMKEKFYTWENNYWSYKTLIYPTENQKFEISNVRNECGIGQVSQTLDINVVPVRVFFNDYNAPLNSIICLTYPYTFSYKVYGQKSTTKISAQISDLNGKNFKDVTLLKAGNPMTIIFPKDTEEGQHKMRLVTTENNQNYYSEERDIRIIKPGIATLSAPDGSNSVETAGNTATLKATFSGSPSWDFFIPNVKYGSYLSIYDKQTTFSVNPSKKTTYKILEAENNCGYNEIKGEVTVSVKPNITILGANPSRVCSNQTAEISYNIIGDFTGDEEISFTLSKSFSLSNPVTIAKIKQSQANNKLSFKVPATLAEGTYYIGWQINGQSTSSFYPNQTITINAIPTGVLAGNTTINAGSSTSINLITTGSKPIDYELSDGTKGTISFNDLNYINLKPSTTTTYSIKSMSNTCGTGTISGTAKITINPVADRYISANQLNFIYKCGGQASSVAFNTRGSFSATNKFLLQISDANGDNFTTISGIEATSSPINFNLPTSIAAGKNYRLRVISTDPNTSAEATPQSFEVASVSSVSMTAIKNNIQSLNDNVSIQFDLKGTPPWNLSVSDSLQRIYSDFLTVTQTPFVHTYAPKQLYTFRLNRITNSCGVGTIEGNAYIRFGLVTADEGTENWNLNLFPNPVTNIITLQHPAPFEGSLFLSDANGKTLISKQLKTDLDYSTLDLSELSTGIYFIKIADKQRSKVWKIIKD